MNLKALSQNFTGILILSFALISCAPPPVSNSPSPSAAPVVSASPPETPAASLAPAASPTADASPAADASQLSPQQKQQLQALGMKIIVPTYVPEGFQLKDVVAINQPRERFRGPQYILLYQGPEDACFQIESTPGGVGGLPDQQFRTPIDTPMGQFLLNYGGFRDEVMAKESPNGMVITEWTMVDQDFYRLSEARNNLEGYQPPPSCKSPNPEEMIKVIKSFVVLENTGTASSSSSP